MARDKVVLAYSGGLDTSVAVKWINETYGLDVIAYTCDLGQGQDIQAIRQKALRTGAVEAVAEDARNLFVDFFAFPSLMAGALYEGKYPLATALGRPLIAQLMVRVARDHGAVAVAHGCTGKGNDQVRFDVTFQTLAPELKIIAPVRGWQMGREEEVAYAHEHGIPIKGGSEAAPYSIDDNIWGRSSEGGSIEDIAEPPHDDVFQLVTRPELAPDEPETVEIRFDAGVPVAIDGEALGLVELLDRAAELGCRHGVGIVDHIEDRIVGLKVRDIYEVPAAALILTAHSELERLVGTIHQNQFKPRLDQQWAYLVYAGLWWEPLRLNLDAYMDSVNEWVSGTIALKLYKGSVRAVTRQSPHAVYDAQLATFSDSGGLFSQQASPGFIELWSLQSRMAWRLRNAASDEG